MNYVKKAKKKSTKKITTPKYKKGGTSGKKFKPHMMYSKSGRGVMARTIKDHLSLKAKGYTHTKPKKKKR